MATPIQQNGKDTLMRIEISYGFHTDGDYSLKTPKKFGCIGENEHFDFIGTKTFTNNETWRCKLEAKTFLEQLLCDGIHISHTHYWLMEDFYDIIDSLIDFINALGILAPNNRSPEYVSLYSKIPSWIM